MKRYGMYLVLLGVGQVVGQGGHLPIWFNPLVTPELVAEELASGRFPVDIRNEQGLTGLMYAAQRGVSPFYDVARLLIDAKADVNAKSSVVSNQGYQDYTPLHFACLFGDGDLSEDIINLLLDNKADVNAVNSTGDAPVHIIMLGIIADLGRRQRVFDRLIALKADPNIQNRALNTMLHFTVDNNDVYWVNAIKGPYNNILNYDLRNEFRLTPAEYAKSLGHEEVQNALMDHPPVLGSDGNMTVVDDMGRTPLMLAVLRGDVAFAREQLNRGALPNTQDNEGNTALQLAFYIKTFPMEMIRMLVPVTDVNLPNSSGDTAMHLVVELNSAADREEAARMLIQYGANVLVQDNNLDTVMHKAVRRGDAGLVEYLKQQFGIIVRNIQDKTALDEAKQLGLSNITAILEK